MGLFSIFKKKELSPQETAYVHELETFHEEFKARHQFQEGWHSVNLSKNDIILSFSNISGLQNLSISLSPRTPGLVQKGQPADILIDLSLNSEKTPEECQKVFRELSQPLIFFQTEFEPSQIISENKTQLPRLSAHGAGVTGFWLWLPIPENAFKNVEAFDSLTAWCLRVAHRLSD